MRHYNKVVTIGSIAMMIFAASCSKDSDNSLLPSSSDTLVPNIPLTSLSAADSADNGNLLLGNPTEAQPSASLPENYLINQTYYISSYNSTLNIPNWTSWHLQSSDLGSVKRSEDFYAYENLPKGWYIVQYYSYSGSTTGFDRGHNCPSGDRTSTVDANNSTFYMTNMIPQAPALNQGPWGGLENALRDQFVGSNNEAYIIMGNYGIGGTGKNGGVDSTIDDGHVSVPSHVWKVAVIIPKGDNDLERIDTSAQIIAVDMPNNNTLYSTTTTGDDAWKDYLVSINEIEESSKKYGKSIDLLKRISTSVKAYLKTKVYKAQ